MKNLIATAILSILLSVNCLANGGIILSDISDKGVSPCTVSKDEKSSPTDDEIGIITSLGGIITSFTGIITSVTGIITSSNPPAENCGIITS